MFVEKKKKIYQILENVRVWIQTGGTVITVYRPTNVIQTYEVYLFSVIKLNKGNYKTIKNSITKYYTFTNYITRQIKYLLNLKIFIFLLLATHAFLNSQYNTDSTYYFIILFNKCFIICEYF